MMKRKLFTFQYAKYVFELIVIYFCRSALNPQLSDFCVKLTGITQVSGSQFDSSACARWSLLLRCLNLETLLHTPAAVITFSVLN